MILLAPFLKGRSNVDISEHPDPPDEELKLMIF